MSKTKPFVYSLGGAALGLLVCTGMGTAHADTHIFAGGNTDCLSTGYMNAAGVNPNDNNVPVAYGTCDGDFAPYLGSTPIDVAIQQGVVGVRAAWNQFCANGVEQCTLHGFSVGAAPVAIVGKTVGADKPGSNTHVITDGNAWGASGTFGVEPGLVGVGVNIGAPFVGAPVHIDQVPNSENRLGVNDAWANDAGQPLPAEITEFSTINGAGNVPPQHIVPNGVPTDTFVDVNGVENKVYGQALPGVMNPADNPVVNPSADPVRSVVSSFFGEQPCVASDGAQYFTPGNAPC